MERQWLTLYDRYLSFKYAMQGMWAVFVKQPNMWIIAFITVLVIVIGYSFELTGIEWCFLFTAIFLVWIAEIFNTALEFLVDLASPGKHPLAAKAKDAAAGGVLIAIILALLIGMIILGPRMLYLLAG